MSIPLMVLWSFIASLESVWFRKIQGKLKESTVRCFSTLKKLSSYEFQIHFVVTWDTQAHLSVRLNLAYNMHNDITVFILKAC